MVDWCSLTIELATKHLGGDGHAEHITSEFTMSVEVVNTSGSFEDLIFKYMVSDWREAQSNTDNECCSMLRGGDELMVG